jgi:hypothetical protein
VISFLRQLVVHDFWLKLFSLALAILVWVTVSFAIRQQGSPVSTVGVAIKERPFYNLPVTIVSSTEDVRNVKVTPGEVEVTVQGDARLVDQLHSKDIRAIVDVTGGGPAPDMQKPVEVFTPPGVTFVRVVPAEVHVVFPTRN